MSLLNLPYSESLDILQSAGKTVTLVVSQVFSKNLPLQEKSFNNLNSSSNSNMLGNLTVKSPAVSLQSCIREETNENNNLVTTPSKSLPNLLSSKLMQLPKVILS